MYRPEMGTLVTIEGHPHVLAVRKHNHVPVDCHENLLVGKVEILLCLFDEMFLFVLDEARDTDQFVGIHDPHLPLLGKRVDRLSDFDGDLDMGEFSLPLHFILPYGMWVNCCRDSYMLRRFKTQGKNVAG